MGVLASLLKPGNRSVKIPMPLKIGILDHQRHADAQVPLDVTMEEPLARIVGIELDHQVVFRWHGDRVFRWWIF